MKRPYRLFAAWLLSSVYARSRILVLPVLVLSLAYSACGARLGVESFDYPNGPIANAVGGGLWDWDNVIGTHTGSKSDWDNVSGSPTVLNGALVTLGNSAKREYNGPGEGGSPGEAQGAVNGANVAKVVYYRVKVTRSPGAEQSLVASLDFGAERISFGAFSSMTAFGIDVAGGARNFSFIVPEANRAYTLVAKIDYAGDKLRLYVDPDLAQAEPGSANVEVTYTGTHWSTAVRVASTGSGSTTWDDVAVATTWEELRSPVVVTTVADQDDGTANPASGGGTSLREAINHSPAGSYISFDPGLSGRTIQLALGEIGLVKDVTIDGSGLPHAITIDARSASRIFVVGRNVTLDSIILTGGSAIEGGAIHNNGPRGLDDSGLVVSHCTFKNNSGTRGGAIFTRSKFTLNYSTLAQNLATFGGGGVYDSNSLFPITLNNSTLSGNSAADVGGGIFGFTGNLKVNQCTLSGNSAATAGGGIYIRCCFDVFDSASSVCVLSNSIVSGNTAPTGSDLAEGTEGERLNFFPLVGTNLIGSLSGTRLTLPTNAVVGAAALFPLGHYGGPTPTMPPRAGSLAINGAGFINPGGTDQRGLARFLNGALDIGSVEAIRVTVQNSDDSGPGSLRQTIAEAPPYAIIDFDPSLAGGRIVLNGAPITIDKPLSISAYFLPNGLTLDADGRSRIFRITTNATGVNLDSLTLTGGKVIGDGVNASSYLGGAVVNEGNLILNNCTLHNNTAGRGGAIYNGAADGVSPATVAQLTLNNSTLSGNTAVLGGALYNFYGRYLLNHATVSGNTAVAGTLEGGAAFFGSGGGISGLSSQETMLNNSIVAGNVAPNGLDISQQLVGFTTTGKNLIGVANTALDPLTTIATTDPRLLPLGHYGGPTLTLHPRQNSPAIDAAGIGPASAMDQRGFARLVNGVLDIGAVEAGPAITVSNVLNSGAGSLRQAIADANVSAGKRILFAPALSGATINLTSGQLTINQPVIIDASALSARVSLNAQGLSRILEVGSLATGVGINSLILIGGAANADGGGILNLGNLTLSDSYLLNSSATRGAGIRNSGVLQIHFSVLDQNHASLHGGGIYNDGILKLQKARIVANIATSDGGGIFNLGTLDLENSTLDGNQANRGGGLYSDTDLTTQQSSLKTSTLALNSAAQRGGGIYNHDGLTTLLQCTISSNTAPANAGGGVASYGDNATRTTVQGTIVSGNGNNDVDLVVATFNNSFSSSGYNLVGNGNALAAFNTTGDLINVRNPLLLPLGDYGGSAITMHPASGSPAIDAGGTTDPGGTDQRGFSRFVNGALDIGAVEAVFGPQIRYFAVLQVTNQLEITYDLIDPETQFLEVQFDFSRDAGNTWAVGTNATGALGSSVEPGSRKKITWNALQDLGPVFITQLRVRLTVTGRAAQVTSVSSDNIVMDTRPRMVLVKGRVLDTLGNPVPGASVAINALPAVLTSASGEFAVPNVPRAGGTLTASNQTYSSHTRQIATIAGIQEHVVDDIKLNRLAFQVSDITRDVEGIYLGGDFPFDVRATAHIDWGGRTRGHVNFYLGNTLLERVQNPVGNETTITFNTAERASGLLPYSTVELRAEAVAANAEVSRVAKETLEFVGVTWLDVLPFRVYQVGGFEPRYTFFTKWPVEIAEFFDLGIFGKLGVDLSVNLGMVYAPRSGEWELWLGDADNVRSDWRPRGLEESAGGFVLGLSKLSLDTRAFARGRASHLGFGFDQLNVQSTLSYNQRLGELCVTDFIPATAGTVRSIGNVVAAAGFDFNSLQCIRFDLDIDGTLRLAAAAPSGELEFQDGSFTAGGTLSAYYKPELGKLVELLAKISGGISLTLGVPNFEYRETTITALAEFKAATTIPFIPNLSYEVKWVLLDETFPSGQGGGGGGGFNTAHANSPAATTQRRSRVMEVIDSRILSGMPTIAPGETFVANNNQGATPLPSEPDPGFGAGGGQGAVFTQTNQVLVQNVSSNISHALAARGNELMLVYTRPASSNTQELVWSLFNGSSWSTPAAVPGAVSAAILQPTIAYDGNGTAVLVWQQFRATPAFGADIAAVTGALELKSSRFAGGSWFPIQTLTDNALYDGEPELCGTLPDGDLLLVWRQSQAGDFFGVRGALLSRRWDSSTQSWGAPEQFDNSFTGTSDFSCASGDGKVMAVWSADADEDFATITDTDLYYRIWQNGVWGAPIRYTTDVVPDQTPRVAINENGTVFMAWVKNGLLMFSQDFGAPSVIQDNPDVLGMSDLHLSVGPTGNPLLLWQEPFQNGSDGRYAVYDATAGFWGQSAMLWKDRDAEHAFELAWDSAGQLAVTYLKDRLVSTTQELTAVDSNEMTVTLTLSNITETASVDLVFTKRALISNLTMSDFVVADELFLPGNSVLMTAMIVNTGDRAVQNPTVRFSFIPDNGSPEIVISNRVFSGWMPAQSTQVFTATWIVPITITRGRLVATADPLGAVTESDESVADNQKSISRGGTDLAVAFKSKNCYPNGTARVIASVFNAGAPASPGTALEVWRANGSLVASASVPSIAPGDTYDVIVDLQRGFQTTIFDTYTIEIDPVAINDSDVSNNGSSFSLYLSADALDPFPVTNGLQLRLTAKAGTSTTVNGAPVASWIDQQNGHEFTNANATLPTYVADSGGGKPALDFTRSSGFIGSFSPTAGATIGDATIFVVGRFAGYTHPASDASYWFSIDSSTGGSEHTLGRQERAGVGPNALYHSRGQPAQMNYYGTNIVEDPGGAFTLYSTVFRSAASGGGVTALINLENGNLVNIDGHPNSGYEADPSKTRIGLATSNGSGLDGRIRELVIFNRILSLPEIVQVYDYLARQAAVTMPLTILAQPADTGGCPGGTATFFVAPSSDAVTYQWQRRLPGAGAFQNISGATTMTYSTPTLAPGDDGTAFRVIVSGMDTNVTSTEALLSVISLTAPSVVYDFNDGLPTNTAVYGHAFIDDEAGVLELNENAPSQAGAFLTTDLAPGTLVHGFTAVFQARLQEGSPTPADGFSFNWATDLPNGTYAMAEQGEGSGLRVTFDTRDNGAAEAPAIEVWWANNLIARRPFSIPHLVRGPDFFDVQLRLTPDGRLDLTYGCEPIFSRLLVTGHTPLKGARFGLGSRTSDAYETHSIDNFAVELYLDPISGEPHIISINRQPPAGILIDGTGAPGQKYIVEASIDLLTWTRRAEVVPNASGLWQLLEPNIAASPYRFYRLLGTPQFPPGLVTWYRAEGNYLDSFGTNHGTAQGGLGFAAGQHGEAFLFDGDASMLIGRGPIPVPWTAAFFVNRQDGPDISALLLSDNSTALKLEQPFFSRLVGFTQYGVADYYFNHIVPANTWQHLTFVGTPSGTVLYTNGVPIETNAAVVNLPMHRLGRHENGADRLKGLLDEVTLFNRALTPGEVQQLYNASRAP